jgi:putative endonuclease
MTKADECWKVYLITCADNSLYCGIAKDVAARIEKHNAGKGAKYTQSRRPVKLVTVSREMSKSDALKLEYCIKKQSKEDKIRVMKEKGVREVFGSAPDKCLK